jgi:hypothetical protein
MVSGEEEEEEIVTTRSDRPIASESQRESSLSMTSEIQTERPILIEFMDNKIRDQVEKPKDVTSKQVALRKCAMTASTTCSLPGYITTVIKCNRVA